MTKEKKGKEVQITEIAVNDTNTAIGAANLSPMEWELFEDLEDTDLLDLSSTLLKLGEGEVINLIATNEIELLFDEEKQKDYEAFVCYGRKEGKVLVADAVFLSTLKRLFENNKDLTAIPVRVICKGMKVAANGKNQYRDLRILSNVK